MAIAKRVFLFLIVNMAMMITISLVLSVLGVGRYMGAYGLNYESLAIYCFVWGMAGSFISLLLSRFMAKWQMGVQIVDPNASGEAGELVRMVHNLARAARLPAMPEVGIYDSPEVNAFATGPTKARSLVAVSSGLLRTMSRQEQEGVLAHEIAHVANGDMVTLTLIQGVVNAFVMFLARIAGFALSQALAGNRDERDSRSSPMMYWLTTMMFEILFGLIGAMIVAWFSRWREFRADAGGARLAGREKMTSALQRLQRYVEAAQDPRFAAADAGPAQYQAMKISSRPGGFLSLLATHPPLEVRIQRLQQLR